MAQGMGQGTTSRKTKVGFFRAVQRKRRGLLPEKRLEGTIVNPTSQILVSQQKREKRFGVKRGRWL